MTETSGTRILVADDDADLRRLLARELRRAGYQVIEAADVDAVIDRLAPALRGGAEIGAIVSDLRMPGLSGLDLLALLRCAEVQLPVILISSFNDASVRAEALSLGAAAVMDKPLEAGALAALVETVVARGRQAVSA